MKFAKKTKVATEIPMASLPDIIFMLLFFFMVTTVLRTYTGLQVEIPDAEAIQKIEGRRHISYLWIDASGQMSVNDIPVAADRTLYNQAYQLRIADPMLIMSLKYDRRVEMGLVAKAQEQLRKAGALRVNFATKTKGS